MTNKNNYILNGIIEMIKTTLKNIAGGESVGPPPEWPED